MDPKNPTPPVEAPVNPLPVTETPSPATPVSSSQATTPPPLEPTPPPVMPAEPPTEPKKNFLPLILIGILILLILGLGAYIFTKRTAAPKQLTTATVPQPTKKPKEARIKPQQRYRIYTSKKYDFLFKYPAQLIRRKDNTDEMIGFLTKRNDNESQKLVVTVLPNPENQELEAFVKAQKTVPYDWTDTAFEKQTINGHEAIVKRSERPCTGVCDNTPKEKRFVIYVTSNTYVVSFAMDKVSNIGDTTPDEIWINRIVSSFSIK